MPGPDAYISVYRGWSGHQKDPQTSWIMGSEGKAPATGQPISIEHPYDFSASQVPSSEDYLYCDPDYPIEAYASWFLQNRPWDLTEWCVRIRPKCRQLPIISITWSHHLIPANIPEQSQNCNPAWSQLYCGFFFLDAQEAFWHNFSLKKQVLITSPSDRFFPNLPE